MSFVYIHTYNRTDAMKIHGKDQMTSNEIKSLQTQSKIVYVKQNIFIFLGLFHVDSNLQLVSNSRLHSVHLCYSSSVITQLIERYGCNNKQMKYTFECFAVMN